MENERSLFLFAEGFESNGPRRARGRASAAQARSAHTSQ